MSTHPENDGLDAAGTRRACRVLTWKAVRLVVAAPGDVLAAAARLLGLQSAAASARDRRRPDVEVAAGDSGYRLRSRVEICTAPCREDAVMKLVALLSFHFLDETEATVLHAGAFVGDAGAILFCGAPCAGKSSLSLAAWRRGRALLGDDWIVLNPGGTVSAFPKPVKLRLASRRLEPGVATQLPPADHLVARLGDEVRLALGRFLPRMLGFDAEIPVAALFLLERGPGPTLLAPAPRDVALLALLTQTMRTRGRRLAGVALLEALRRQGRVYRLTVGEGDVEGAIEAMIGAPAAPADRA